MNGTDGFEVQCFESAGEVGSDAVVTDGDDAGAEVVGCFEGVEIVGGSDDFDAVYMAAYEGGVGIDEPDHVDAAGVQEHIEHDPSVTAAAQDDAPGGFSGRGSDHGSVPRGLLRPFCRRGARAIALERAYHFVIGQALAGLNEKPVREPGRRRSGARGCRFIRCMRLSGGERIAGAGTGLGGGMATAMHETKGDQKPVASAMRVAGEARSGWRSPAFILAVVLLGSAAVLSGPVSSRLKFTQEKDALPLRKPFDLLDASKLGPYRVTDRLVFEPVVVEALGTDQYLMWRLEDTRLEAGDPLRVAQVFVTYYTGGGNLVPHTPDVCYLGSGYQPKQAHENVEVGVPGRSEPIPMRLLTFERTAIFDRSDFSVTYTFHCNGAFTETRSGVRILTGDPRARYAYFSKIELSFPRASRDETQEGAARVLEYLLPVLLADHFPDYERAEREAGDEGGAAARTN